MFLKERTQTPTNATHDTLPAMNIGNPLKWGIQLESLELQCKPSLAVYDFWAHMSVTTESEM